MIITISSNNNELTTMHIFMSALPNSPTHFEILMGKGTTMTATDIMLSLHEQEILCSFLKTLPADTNISLGDDRLQFRREERKVGLIDTYIRYQYLIITLYDVSKDSGHVVVEYELEKMDVTFSKEDTIIDKHVITTSKCERDKMIFELTLNEDDKDEYYYGGHIKMDTSFFWTNRALIVNIDEAERTLLKGSVFQTEGSIMNFCPLGEFLDITFSIRDGEFIADGNIMDPFSSNATYFFHLKIKKAEAVFIPSGNICFRIPN